MCGSEEKVNSVVVGQNSLWTNIKSTCSKVQSTSGISLLLFLIHLCICECMVFQPPNMFVLKYVYILGPAVFYEFGCTSILYVYIYNCYLFLSNYFLNYQKLPSLVLVISFSLFFIWFENTILILTCFWSPDTWDIFPLLVC